MNLQRFIWKVPQNLTSTYDIKNWLDACISLGNIYSKLGEFSNAEFYLNEGLESIL